MFDLGGYNSTFQYRLKNLKILVDEHCEENGATIINNHYQNHYHRHLSGTAKKASATTLINKN